jgi:hypothetical protein
LGAFTGSFLLFMIQPLTGKILLPVLGGVPAVWTACMLFFQATLLLGYIYSEKSIKYLGCEKQSIIHLLLMALGISFLPLDIFVNADTQASAQPFFWIFSRLTNTIGFLFFIVAANAPLLQRWYSQTDQKDRNDPYFLYSASNIGSLLALLAYPFIFEPFMGVGLQKHVWSLIYIILTIINVLCAFSFWKEPKKERLEKDFKQQLSAPWSSIFRWIIWAFIPCSAMLGVTTHIATDIASGPLLWIFPLSIFLGSFILVYAKTNFFRNLHWISLFLPFSVLISIMYFFRLNEKAWFAIPLHLLYLFICCMYFHSRLALDRPKVKLLNSYFVWMSVGGIIGGLFNSILAPILFKTQLEYIITIIIGFLAAVLSNDFSKTENNGFKLFEFFIISAFIIILLVFTRFSQVTASKFFSLKGFAGILFAIFTIHFCLKQKKLAIIMFLTAAIILIIDRVDDKNVLYIDRSFFGIHKINRVRAEADMDDPDLKIKGEQDIFYCLVNGTTVHGVERKVDVRPIIPLSYYAREGPAGDIFRSALIQRWGKHIGIVGLGAGTLAWYGRPWQNFDFYEIDPSVIRIATNPNFFTYLHHSKADWKIIKGDARIKLQSAPDNYYDILILDAYSSDAVPIHLLTIEAIGLYLQKLKPDGLLALHLSNRYFKLSPVVANIFSESGVFGISIMDDPKNYSIKYDWYDETQLSKSFWVAGSKDLKKLKLLKAKGNWQSLEALPAYSIWTDNYANILQVYNWQ